MGKHVTKRKNSSHNKPAEKRIKASTQKISDVVTVSVPELIRVATACVLIILISFFKLEGVVELIAYLIPYFLVSYDLYLALISRINRETLLSDALIFLAASVLAAFVGAYFEAVVIVVLYRLTAAAVGYLQKIQHDRQLMHDGSDGETCLVKTPEGLERISADQVCEGDSLLLRKGDRLAADAVLLDDSCSMDVSFLTGDHSPCVFQPGDFIPSGSISLSGENVTVRACAESDQSCYSLLRERLNRSDLLKSSFERITSDVLHYVDLLRIPLALVLILAGGLASGQWSEWILRGIILLSATDSRLIRSLMSFGYRSCVLHAADGGIYLKNNDTVEKLSHAQTAVFEKSGVITDSVYELRDCKPEKISERELIAYAAKMLSRFSNPMSPAFLNAADPVLLEVLSIDNCREFPGKGYSALLNGKRAYLGNPAFIAEFSHQTPSSSVPGKSLHLVMDGDYKGYAVVSDKLKEGVFDAFEKMRANGVSNLVMLTEESAVSARKLAMSLNIDMIRAEITPEEKRNSLEYLIKNKNKGTSVAFVGSSFSDEGLYDAADVGIVLQPLRSIPPVRSEADVVIFSSILSKVSEAVDVCAGFGQRVKNLFYAGAGAAALLAAAGASGLLGLLPCLILLILISAAEVVFAVKKM